MTRSSKPEKKPIEQYDHKGKERCNNPPVGLVTPETDSDSGKKTYAYDPHLDPALVWAGKAEHTSPQRAQRAQSSAATFALWYVKALPQRRRKRMTRIFTDSCTSASSAQSVFHREGVQ